MARTALATVLTLLALAATAPAQTPARLRWQTGQVLTYKVEHATRVVEVVGETTVETKSQLNLTKRWQVVAVDASGAATLQLSLAALRIETTTPGGEKLLFDSANPDKNSPLLDNQKFVGPTLAVLRLDPTGKVLEVKESKFGPASRFECEPPFALVLPPAGLQANQTWERAYKITLEPPQGTGEKYDAVQHYTCKRVADGAATLTLTSELKKQPEALADRIPLLQVQPEGELVFDVQAGRLRSAALKIEKELKGHQGEGSSYRLQSSYTEQFVADR